MQVFTYLILNHLALSSISLCLSLNCSWSLSWFTDYMLRQWGIFGSVSVVRLLFTWAYILLSARRKEEIQGVGLGLFSFFSIYILWSSRIFLKVLQSSRKHFFLSPKILHLKKPQTWAGFTLTNLSIVLKDLVDIDTPQWISLKWSILQHFRWRLCSASC